jgi:nicotinate-nucleotide pyrophosphorylase (carboxylating)
MNPDISQAADRLIRHALREDIGSGDITSAILIPVSASAKASIVARERCVVAGLPFAARVFEILDPSVRFTIRAGEGVVAKRGAVIATVSGNARVILAGERTALNLLQRMCGIATLTRQFVSRLRGTGVQITDTRKTAPGLRLFDKYAVRTGGGQNHRFGLFDGILIKDNHIKAAGGIGRAVRDAKKHAAHLMKIEVEAGNLREVKEALRAGADVIMLDNMGMEEMKKAVRTIREAPGTVLIEASGNIDLENVRAVAETGVDIISSGALTHSVRAADLSMKFD